MTIGARPGRQRVTTGIFCLDSWIGIGAPQHGPSAAGAPGGAGGRQVHPSGGRRQRHLLRPARRWPSHRGYRLGYIACHGEPGTLRIGSDSSNWARSRGRLAERGVTFGARRCTSAAAESSRCPPSRRLTAFRTATGAQAVCGYRGEDGVEWLESAAFELTLFDYLATSGYKTALPALREFRRDHSRAPGSASGSSLIPSRDLHAQASCARSPFSTPARSSGGHVSTAPQPSGLGR